MSCVGSWASSFGTNFTNNVMSNFTTPGGGVGAGATAAINGTNALIQSAAGLTRMTFAVQAVRGIEGGVIGGVAGGGSTAAWVGAAAGTAVGIALIPVLSATAVGALAGTAGAILAGAAAQAAYQTFNDQGMPGVGCPGDQNGDGFPDGQEPPPGTPPAGGAGTGGIGGFGGPAGGGSPWGMGGNPLHPPPRDPLVLDLDHDGLELISVAQSQVNFDLDANGFAERTGWVSPDDGFLVRDANGNGAVDGVAELFGNANEDGFDALAHVDANGDGKIDAQDPIWSHLRIWRDADSDGQTDPGELHTLAELGVTALPLASVASTLLVAGNGVGRQGTYVLDGGQSGGMFSTYFAVNTQLSQWTPPAGFQLSALGDKAPALKGFGNVADLAVAITNDPALATAVQSFLFASQGMDGVELRQAFEALMLKWAGAEAVSDGSRGANVEAKHLAVLEAFFGTSYLEPNGATNPNAVNGRILEASYDDLVDSYLTQFMSQAAVSRVLVSGDDAHFEDPDILYAALTANAATGWMMGDPTTTLEALVVTAPEAPAQWAKYFDRTLTITSGMRLDFYGGDGDDYRAAWSSALTHLDDDALSTFVASRMDGLEITYGGDGADTISGTSGAEMLVGGLGNDSLTGGRGDDVFVWARGDGADVVSEGYFDTADKLLLLGVNAADVTLVRNGSDVTLVVAPTVAGGADGGSVKLLASLNEDAYGGVEQIVLADATWTRADLRLKLLAQASTSGADTITGFNTADTITGGAGNDSITGGRGDDRYVWTRGDGADVVSEGYFDTADKLVLQGVNAADVGVVRTGGDVTLVIAPTVAGGADGGSVKLLASLDEDTYGGVEQIVFADATWTRADLRLKLLAQASTPGADTITGFNTADTITGGAGADSITGGRGDDRYVWARGDGADTINEGYYDTGDKLVLQGVDPADVTLVRSGGDVILTIAPSTGGGADGGSVRLIANIDEDVQRGVEQILFADGTIWTRADLRARLVTVGGTSGADTLTGTNVGDLLAGGGGNDSITGGRGDDSYIWARGDGADTISEGYYDTADKLFVQGVAPADVTLVRNGGDVTLVVAPTTAGGTDGGSVKLLASLNEDTYGGVEQVVFDDGTIWTRADLRLKLLAQASTSGADTITGFNTADTITGGAGNDSITGGRGDDRYVWARGDGADTISEGYYDTADKLVLQGVNAADVSLVRSGGDVTLVIAPTAAGGADGGSVKLLANLNEDTYGGVEQIVFADGEIWTRADLRLKVLAEASTSGADTITGFNTADTLAGGAGSDSITGGRGDDRYVWARGDGADTISEGYYDTADKLVLQGVDPADVTLVRSGGDVTLVVAPTVAGGADGGSVKLLASLNEDAYGGVEQVMFADGTIWTRSDLRLKLLAQASTSGSDTITGFNTADTIAGGAGADSITGGRGDDVFVWARGDGADVVSEGYFDTADKLVLQGVNSADVSLVRSGGDVTLVIAPTVAGGADGGSVKLLASLDEDTYGGVEQVVFADATWTRADLRLKLLAQASTSGADTIVGFNTADTLLGDAGADSLSGASGADVLVGGNGADTLSGGGSADVFRFDAIGESVTGAPDIITDFASGTDKISLIAIDANSAASGDQAFTFIGTAAFSSVAGQLRYAAGPTGARTLQGDVDGDGVADFAIQLTGTGTLQASDFLL